MVNKCKSKQYPQVKNDFHRSDLKFFKNKKDILMKAFSRLASKVNFVTDGISRNIINTT